jgi:hypothetical protein
MVIVDPLWMDIFNQNDYYAPLPVTNDIIKQQQRKAIMINRSGHSLSIPASSLSFPSSSSLGGSTVMDHPIYYVPVHPLTSSSTSDEDDSTMLSSEWIAAAQSVGQSITPQRYAPPYRSIFEDSKMKQDMTNDEWLDRYDEMKQSHLRDWNRKLWLLTDDIVCHVGLQWVMVWQLSSGRCLQHWKLDWNRVHKQPTVQMGNGWAPVGLPRRQQEKQVICYPSGRHSVDRRRYWLWCYGPSNASTVIWDIRSGRCLTPFNIQSDIWPSSNASRSGVPVADYKGTIPDHEIHLYDGGLSKDIDLIYHWDYYDIMIVITRRTCWFYDLAHVHHLDDLKHVKPLVLARLWRSNLYSDVQVCNTTYVPETIANPLCLHHLLCQCYSVM